MDTMTQYDYSTGFDLEPQAEVVIYPGKSRFVNKLLVLKDKAIEVCKKVASKIKAFFLNRYTQMFLKALLAVGTLAVIFGVGIFTWYLFFMALISAVNGAWGAMLAYFVGFWVMCYVCGFIFGSLL